MAGRYNEKMAMKLQMNYAALLEAASRLRNDNSDKNYNHLLSMIDDMNRNAVMVLVGIEPSFNCKGDISVPNFMGSRV